jgi:class 3 adenylate cyclase/tetratricopeptide (TPR) repeat protein
MICTRCGTDNRAGRKFCSQCAAPLALTCAACGAPNEPGERFCGECAAPLGAEAARGQTRAPATAATPVAERRLVSVLFADLVNFTSLSEQRDPEEVRELLSRYFDLAREVIARYGGEVEKFIGDAVMAVWGTPVAHEDDAERAVRAGLDLVDTVTALGREVGAPDLRLRAGVLSGSAAVTVGAQGEGMVAGDLVNTASRLQSAAALGTVLVGETTFHAAREAITFEHAGAHVVKGKELPVQAWRAVRVVAGTGGARRTHVLEPPFVGREEELRLLKDLLHATERERRPRLVSVSGVGGIGKSRLAWELQKYVDGIVEPIYWHQGRCPAYGEGVSFWALGEMVRMRARIAESEEAGPASAKLHEAVERYVVAEEERRWIEPRLGHLLGLEQAPSTEREELFAAWRAFFEAIAAQGTTVLVFEDLQWADPGLIDFIEHLLEWARRSPILIVTLARPELMERRPNWGAGQRSFSSLHLSALGDEEMRKLLAGIAEGLPDHVGDQIVERAEGVPLYAVETVRMLIDQGRLVADESGYRLLAPLEHLEVPDTLHSLIAARLDALDPDDRALLQDASVLGKAFTLDALSVLKKEEPRSLEARLNDLVRKELLVVEADPWSPERGQYLFLQSLIREVAYGTLARAERLSRHLAAATYFHSLDDDELAGVVATHYMEARAALPPGADAEELASKARGALAAAAERAASLGAHVQALAYVEQALAIAPDPQARMRLCEQAAETAVKGGAYEAGERQASEALALYERAGDALGMARSATQLGRALVLRGHPDVALEATEAVLERVRDLEDHPDVLRLTGGIAANYMMLGKSERSLAHCDAALPIAERIGDDPLISFLLNIKGVGMHQAGRWREATALSRAGVDLGEESSVPPMEQGMSLVNLSHVLLVPNPSGALAAARRALDVARRFGLRAVETVAAMNASGAAISTAEWDWAEALLAQQLREELADNDRALLEVAMGRLAALRGDVERASEKLVRAEPIISALSSPQDLASLREAESVLAIAEGRLQDAREKATAAVAADPFSEYGLRGYLRAGQVALWLSDEEQAGEALSLLEDRRLHGAWLGWTSGALRAGVLALQGRIMEALALYADCIAGLDALGCPFDRAVAQLDLVTLLPDRPEVREAAEQARATFTRLGADPFLERLEQAVARS